MASIIFSAVGKSYRTGLQHNKALHQLDLEVQKGEVFGFLGPNGAGKSTSIKLLLDFIRPDCGDIFVEQHKVGSDPYHHCLGYLPEIPCLYENLTGFETLRFAGKSSGMNDVDIRRRSEEVLRRVDLLHAGRQLVRGYSKGMKQRLGLAVALLHEPPIYIFDEPMSGLDPMGRSLVSDVIMELRQQGRTVFFSSHILSDIERLCDRIGVLNRGKLLYCGTVTDFSGGEDIEQAFVQLISRDNEESHV